MDIKEIVKLATAYVENYQRDLVVEAALVAQGISFYDEQNPLVYAVESILDSVHPMLVEMLLDYAEDGYIIINKENELKTIEEIIKIFIED